METLDLIISKYGMPIIDSANSAIRTWANANIIDLGIFSVLCFLGGILGLIIAGRYNKISCGSDKDKFERKIVFPIMGFLVGFGLAVPLSNAVTMAYLKYYCGVWFVIIK